MLFLVWSFFLWSFFCGLLSLLSFILASLFFLVVEALWCICYDIFVGALLTFGLLLVLWLLCICYVVLFWCEL
ncbi:hypothetical protein EDC94DRAFT_599166, partial [Helicostylum pulchrum]